MARCFYVRGRAGVGWRDTLQVHPCKLDGAIHGANGPATPPRPNPLAFPVSDGKGIVVIGWGEEGSDPFSCGKGI
ncbi:hypothetical protein SGMN_35410 [Stenotrophomonas geniculata]